MYLSFLDNLSLSFSILFKSIKKNSSLCLKLFNYGWIFKCGADEIYWILPDQLCGVGWFPWTSVGAIRMSRGYRRDLLTIEVMRSFYVGTLPVLSAFKVKIKISWDRHCYLHPSRDIIFPWREKVRITTTYSACNFCCNKAQFMY